MISKIYQVILQDEWNNLINIGFYKKLEDAIPDINKELEIYDTKIYELNEYPNTFSICFDKEVEIDDGDNFVYIKGFIFNREELKNEI